MTASAGGEGYRPDQAGWPFQANAGTRAEFPVEPAVPALHAGQPLLSAGQPVDQARAALILLHGRGASAGDILQLTGELRLPEYAYLAPQATGNTWYPYRFLEPVARNEPWLSSALSVVASALAHVQSAGIPAERTVLLGFSQGACLALEFAARNPQRFGGIAGLSGGLIGLDSEIFVRNGSLAGTPVFLGCSDIDPHIPAQRVRLSAGVFQALGGRVETRFYAGMGHTVCQDELDQVAAMLQATAG